MDKPRPSVSYREKPFVYLIRISGFGVLSRRRREGAFEETDFLSNQGHFSHDDLGGCPQAVQIQPRRHRCAVVVAAIPGHSMRSGWQGFCVQEYPAPAARTDCRCSGTPSPGSATPTAGWCGGLKGVGQGLARRGGVAAGSSSACSPRQPPPQSLTAEACPPPSPIDRPHLKPIGLPLASSPSTVANHSPRGADAHIHVLPAALSFRPQRCHDPRYRHLVMLL